MAALPVQVTLTLQDFPDEALDVAKAFAKEPDAVRDALFEAVCLVQLRRVDITLLSIESTFRSTLKKPFKDSRQLRLVLEACRQGKCQNRTECRFFEHGGEYAVAALSAATKDDPRVFREIDPLPDEDLTRLVIMITAIPRKASIVGFIEDFVQSLPGFVPHPPPELHRPRMRRKGAEESQSVSPQPEQEEDQRDKRMKIDTSSSRHSQPLSHHQPQPYATSNTNPSSTYGSSTIEPQFSRQQTQGVEPLGSAMIGTEEWEKFLQGRPPARSV